MDAPRPDVSVVIVSFNTADLTHRCVESVLAEGKSLDLQVIVVDNASSDGSAERIASEFPDVEVIANDENLGFARANNLGFERARGRFLLVLNPDAIVEDDAIERTLRFAESRPGTGAVGCRVFRPDGSQSASFFRYVRLRDLFVNLFLPNQLVRRTRVLARARYPDRSREEVQDVEAIAGCFMLVSREAMEAVGPMDGDFFMYGEEAEWCFRIRGGGFPVLYYPGAHVVHIGGVSTKQRRPQMMLVMARSQLLLMEKTSGVAAAYAANWLMLLRELPRLVLWLGVGSIPALRNSDFGQRLRISISRVPMLVRGVFRREWAA